MTITDRLWEQLEPLVFISRDQFDEGLKSWEIEPVEINGEVAFVALTRGPEFHFASFGTGARITSAMIWERLNRIMDRHGYVTTRTPHDEPRQQRLNERLGFRKTGDDEFFAHFRMDRTCQ